MMEKFRKTFSFRRRKKKHDSNETTKPQQWQEDERKVREGTCSFQVKYLGHIEVFESRGMQVCEEAIKALRKSKKKPQRAILYVSGDALRVADEISKGLIVDQTIEKVSFCAPDRSHDKGFAYICRDGATRRWMCHGFLAVKESGERLSHAVGCAFAICLEKKQKREKEAVQLAFNEDRTAFTRMGSFRQTTLTERLQDPQSAIIAEPPPPLASNNATISQSASSDGEASAASITGSASPGPGSPSLKVASAIPRPHASASMIERQGSLRLFPKLQESSPFKRDLSLRLTDLPSNLQRLNQLNQLSNGDSIPEEPLSERDDHPPSPPAHHPPANTAGGETTISQLASEFARELNALSNQPAAGHSTPSAAMTTTAGVSPIQFLSTSTPGIDPFSAAPVNPATFHHQHGNNISTNPFPSLGRSVSGVTGHSPVVPVAPHFRPFVVGASPAYPSPFRAGQPLYQSAAAGYHGQSNSTSSGVTGSVLSPSTNPWAASAAPARSLHYTSSGVGQWSGAGHATTSDPFDVAWTEQRQGAGGLSAGAGGWGSSGSNTNPFLTGGSAGGLRSPQAAGVAK